MPNANVNPNALHNIDLANEQTVLAVDDVPLRRAVEIVLEDSGQAAATVSIAVVDDPTIHELNRAYLRHDYPTDVLSFSLGEPGEPIDGQIVVSAETAMARAAEYGWPAEHELLLYVVHGALHLVGHDDKSPDAKSAMRAAERRILAMLNISQPDSSDSTDETTSHEEQQAT